ncbi:MAG: type I-E CRISPR-associated protein Cse1/CasA [Lentisphaeria bacterium]|nr:type I-E CRISPR-associated protein Cse1/CasA [Lentisphaeria bacterium]
MNLTTDPWIPVVWEDGRNGLVSLTEAFGQGQEIRDLAVRPHERIALMRLLICVAQAALDGPGDRADWRTCGERLPAAALAYLERWRHAFELFGEGQRFLQVKGLRPPNATGGDEGDSLSKLDLALASGNNTTLFDNAGGSQRQFTPSQVCLMLITYQNFSPGGLVADLLWSGTPTGRSSNHAPCVIKSLAHTYIVGSTLAESVRRNLLTREDIELRSVAWGAPIWEHPPESARDRSNACCTYLGRLVPMSRTVQLERSALLALGQGLTYDGYPLWREACATVVARPRDGSIERQALSLSPAKAVWREVSAITVLDRGGHDVLGGPLALCHVEPEQSCDIWVGGLIADKAKLVDTIEAVFHLPAAMLGTAGQRVYEQGVRHADRWALRLGRALAAYRREQKDELERDQWKRGNRVKQMAAMHFWTAAEHHLSDLLAVVENPDLLCASREAEPSWSGTVWGHALAAAARDAYNLACPHGTPRQMKAYVLGLKVLFREPTESGPGVTAQTEEENE